MFNKLTLTKGLKHSPMDKTISLFEDYTSQLLTFKSGESFSPAFLLEESVPYKVYYSPFDHVNTAAKVVIVGISPGQTQAELANKKAKEAMLNKVPMATAARVAKETASFGGTLRNNLIEMLDYVGIGKYLNICSCASLFEENCTLLHCTSVFRYPVLYNDRPISSAKGALNTPILNSWFNSYFVNECQSFDSDVLFVPLGQGVAELLESLVPRGILQKDQILRGLPHPSGANAERIAYFVGRKNKSDLSKQTNPDSLDQARSLLLKQLARLGVSEPSVNRKTLKVANEEKPFNKTETKKNQKAKVKFPKMGNIKNLLSPLTKYISSEAERELQNMLTHQGYDVSTPSSPKTKELCISKIDKTLAYVSRKTGLGKGMAVITVHPKNAASLDKKVKLMDGITIREGKTSRYISSSNYNGFDSKGFSNEITTNEHVAVAYTVDVNESWQPVLALLKAL